VLFRSACTKINRGSGLTDATLLIGYGENFGHVN
jgi:hypothetical protein